MSPSQAALSRLVLAVPAGVEAPPAERPPTGAKGLSRIVTLAVEVLLSLGAVVGVAVGGITAAAAGSGMRPVVVRSGSMEPTIATGSMILVERIDASAIEVGDVVAVQRPDRTRVIHRVLTVEHRGQTAELTMKGDANEDPDPFPLTVDHAHRLVWEVPVVGRALAWFATARGGFVMGCITTLFLCRATGRRSRTA